jgi:RND superfamily putative drug exporter
VWRKPRRRGSTRPDRETFWQRWTYAVMRRPVVSVVTVTAVLLTMAIPVLSVKTGNGAIKQFDEGSDARSRHRARRPGERRRRRSGQGAGDLRPGTATDEANAAAVRDFAAARRRTEVEAVAPAVASGNR